MKSTNKKIQISRVTFMSLIEKFPTDKAFINFFIKLRYPEGLKCCNCGSDKVFIKSNRPKSYNCNQCKNSYSIFRGTIFENSRISFKKWLYAIHMVINAKKGVSACQISREIGGDYRTAWRLMHKIREAMVRDNGQANLFESIVEIDETYIGGRVSRQGTKHIGRGTSKTPVMGIFDRETGKVKAEMLLPDRDGKRLTSIQLLEMIEKHVNQKALHITDELRGYKILKRWSREHEVINHSVEYVRDYVHTNNIENFWGLLKRGILGQFHHVSVKYLPAYISEFTWRFNNRENENVFMDFLIAC